ncbi:pyruvate formate-lyase-activating protein [Anaeromicrobium sediminis]|uniref:Pyruvate formate-lyase-activating enzyme n=1 Tax=Anaeromicrobium sediminis TaxID=1478221 RepID=A0A267MNP4_9FIRM|nr:pyruvate formate-lyase-activating protein [Anaeromicrobium sediminis]PAB60370.1 pyruvate formate-lyase 1-activating enzyme [Anaeromicrobium sediminis]
MLGKIHSIETLGLKDGPGIRFVVFFQGCKLRCAYCHNPDTWILNEGKDMSAEELLQKALRFKPYFERSGGGITCSGGDPLLQPEFLIKFLKLCKEHGLHTTVDTAGFGLGNYEEILKYTDLVILDVKHVNRKGYRELVRGNIEEFRRFTEVLRKSNVNLWIRHVVVPGITDGEKHISELKELISEFHNVEKIELLPYHTLGVNKYEIMGIPYRLQGIKPMCREKIKTMEDILISA